MAKIENLIAQISDRRLRDEIAAEVKALKRTKKFGLVYEEHLPETVRLPLLAVRPGELVALKTEAGDRKWRVRGLQRGVAICDPVAGPDEAEAGRAEFPVVDLIVIRNFGEPIYPSLVPIDRVERGAASKPWHLLINADNYHALQLLLYCYEGKLDVIYIDPPYNTGARDWKYNNDYVDRNDIFQHSKWLSMMKKRLTLAHRLLKPTGVLVIAIDDYEVHHLRTMMEQECGRLPELGTVVIRTSPSGRPTLKGFRTQHDYALFYGAGPDAQIGQLDKSAAQLSFYAEADDEGRFAWVNLRKRGGANTRRAARPKQFYPIYVNGEALRIPELEWNKQERSYKVLSPRRTGEVEVWPISPTGEERIWSLAPKTARASLRKRELRVEEAGSPKPQIFRKQRPATKGSQPSTLWEKSDYSTVEHGSVLLTEMLGKPGSFNFPKSLYTVADCLRVAGADRPDAVILDFFGGSGTTFHATALLNARDGGSRRCILVTNNEVDEQTSRELARRGVRFGDKDYEQAGICESVTWPRCKAALLGRSAAGDELSGDYLGEDADGNKLCLGDGLAENIEYCRLDFLDSAAVARGDMLRAILPLLWVMAGCRGRREDPRNGTAWYMPEESPMAVLIREKEFHSFRQQLETRRDIVWAFLVTDSEENFAAMRRALGRGVQCVQLYKNYLESFRLNTFATVQQEGEES